MTHPRISRGKKTVEAMVSIYCGHHHRPTGGLCRDCRELQAHARRRLEKCPFKEGKTSCAKCPVHCYKPEMREKIRTVMRYSGPRMIYRHPVKALFHMMDGLRKEPTASVQK